MCVCVYKSVLAERSFLCIFNLLSLFSSPFNSFSFYCRIIVLVCLSMCIVQLYQDLKVLRFYLFNIQYSGFPIFFTFFLSNPFCQSKINI